MQGTIIPCFTTEPMLRRGGGDACRGSDNYHVSKLKSATLVAYVELHEARILKTVTVRQQVF